MAFLLAFLLGCVDGLRSLTPPALVCWAAHLGWLHFAGTRLAFIHHRSTLIVFTVLAVAELIADKLPKTVHDRVFVARLAIDLNLQRNTEKAVENGLNWMRSSTNERDVNEIDQR